MATNGTSEVAVRRTPFRELEEFFGTRWPFEMLPRLSRFRLEPGLAPIDMFEKDGKVIVKAEMPGIEPDKVDVTVVGSELRLSGERSEEKEVREEDYYRSERTFGRVYRSITLPEGCDADAVTANMKDGILVVEVGKKQASAPKKIQVKKA